MTYCDELRRLTPYSGLGRVVQGIESAPSQCTERSSQMQGLGLSRQLDTARLIGLYNTRATAAFPLPRMKAASNLFETPPSSDPTDATCPPGMSKDPTGMLCLFDGSTDSPPPPAIEPVVPDITPPPPPPEEKGFFSSPIVWVVGVAAIGLVAAILVRSRKQV